MERYYTILELTSPDGTNKFGFLENIIFDKMSKANLVLAGTGSLKITRDFERAMQFSYINGQYVYDNGNNSSLMRYTYLQPAIAEINKYGFFVILHNRIDRDEGIVMVRPHARKMTTKRGKSIK